jgi:positive regulator of sigma E activity
MNNWQTEIIKIAKLVLGNAGKASDMEIIVCLIVAILAFTLVFKWLAKSFGATMADNGRIFLVTGIGILLLVAATAAINIYLVPTLKNPLIIKWLPLVVCGLITLVVIIPLICFLLKAKYFQSLFSCLLSICAIAGIVMLVHGAFGAIQQGDKEFKKTKERTEGVNDILKK